MIADDSKGGNAIWMSSSQQTLKIGVDITATPSPVAEAMSHIAITKMKDGSNDAWMEHVTDDQYLD